MGMNVSLTKELESFVMQKVKSGRYGSASEVIREGLRLLEKEDLRRQFSYSTEAELEAKLLEGLEELDRKKGIPARQVRKELRRMSDRRRKSNDA